MKQILTIFGSTGDLTIRKLLPAIKRLIDSDLIEQPFKVLLIGRRDYDLQGYIDFVKKN